jgi:hypothetical protein
MADLGQFSLGNKSNAHQQIIADSCANEGLPTGKAGFEQIVISHLSTPLAHSYFPEGICYAVLFSEIIFKTY